jgi:multidrug efflux system outer membrane protein
MKNANIYAVLSISILLLFLGSCKPLERVNKSPNLSTPSNYLTAAIIDSANSARMDWREYFNDEKLTALIDTALRNNQELNIFLQKIQMERNEVDVRQGEFLPSVRLGGAAEVEKVGRFTRNGAVEEQLEIRDGRAFPEPLPNFAIGAHAKWELDVWKKLRNAKKAALTRYLASIEGRNFLLTNLIAEIAENYYDLMALDNLLQIIDQNLKVQANAIKVAKLQKQAGKVSQLAIYRFEAQLLKTKNLKYAIQQKIVEAENRINFLAGRYPQAVERKSNSFMDIRTDSIQRGLPSQLLQNRPDIRQAELELAATKLDVKVAKAEFYPKFDISAGLGFQAFNPVLLLNPRSILYNLAGDIVAPVINRKAIKANYNNANTKQLQAIYEYEQTILNAYVDVLNQLSKLNNYTESFNTKEQEVEVLSKSINIANSLFRSARAEYIEVLLTQEEALDAKMELVEIKQKQLNAKVNIYRALGGGWQ